MTVRNVSPADERSWRELGERAIEPNPFYEPDCLIPAALHQTYGAEIGLVVTEEKGRFVACMPVRFTSRWKVPYPVAISQVRRMNYLGTPLVDTASTVDGIATLLAGVAEGRRLLRGRILILDGLGGSGPVAELVRAAATRLSFPVSVLDCYERGMLRRRQDASYQRIHGSKARYNLRRQRRLLAESCGGAEVKLVDRTEDPDAVSDYLALEASGYKTRTGVAMTTVPGEPDYFSAMCARFAAAGRLHILALEVGGHTIAMEIWVRGGDGLFLIKISYDEQFARFGPGVLLQVAAMEYFHDETDAHWIDTCTSADNEILLRLYPDRRQIQTLSIVLGHSSVDRALVRAFLATRPLHRRYYRWRHPDHVPVGAGHN